MGKLQDKPNCYECKYRGTLPGDCHSCCKHPSVFDVTNNPLLMIMAAFASVGRAVSIMVTNKLNIQANHHGIENGWFNWPFNFDPVWLEKCDGFEPKNNDRITSQGDKTS